MGRKITDVIKQIPLGMIYNECNICKTKNVNYTIPKGISSKH